jgi:hypothetical protein
MCSYILSLSPALDGGGWLTPQPGPFNPRTSSVPIVWETGWPQARWGQVHENPPTPGFDPRTVQSIASRYPGPHTHTHTHIYIYIYRT